MFGNLIDEMDQFKKYATEDNNTKFILFNYPGQAYTLFNEEIVYNNDYNACLIDMFLEELATQGEIDLNKDSFKFIGVGYGANILLYYRNFSFSLDLSL